MSIEAPSGREQEEHMDTRIEGGRTGASYRLDPDAMTTDEQGMLRIALCGVEAAPFACGEEQS